MKIEENNRLIEAVQALYEQNHWKWEEIAIAMFGIDALNNWKEWHESQAIRGERDTDVPGRRTPSTLEDL